jgi:N utilization substance protein A
MKSEFTLAFNEITERFGLSYETVMDALEAAMVSAYRRSVNASSAQAIQAKIDPANGEVDIYAEKEVVDSVENPMTEVTMVEAREVEPEIEMGDMVMVKSTPEDFGRVAAQTAKQVILQRLREAERDAQYDEFIEREGDMVHGTVHSITPQAVTVGLGRAEAILPRNQQIPGERFRVRDRIRVYVLEVRKSSRGPVIVVSRTHPNMLRRLLEMEVPEINQGLVEIKAIAREAGKRAKVAVAALRDGIDPVGACVGLRGVRIQSIVRDLNDEKIDVIEWNPDSAAFISKALSPARVSGVYLDDDPMNGKTAAVVVPEDQLSLAIGRAGVNARLAARLTGWRIDIKSLIEAASECLVRLESDPELAELAQAEEETVPMIEAILLKKEETRPVTPEEYQMMGSFVDRVQKETMDQRAADRQIYLEKLAEARAEIPASAYSVPVAELDLSTRVQNLIVEAGYEDAGRLMEQLSLDEDKILALQGIGPKAMTELKEKLGEYPYPVEEPVEAEEVEAPVEAVEVEAEVDLPEPELAVAAEEIPTPAEAEVTEVETTVVEEAVVEPAPVEVEPAAEVEAEPVEAEEAEEAVEEEPEEEEVSFEEALETAFKQIDEELFEGDVGDEDDELLKRQQRERSRILEFDPETGEMIVRRRRKPGREDDFEVDWEDLVER